MDHTKHEIFSDNPRGTNKYLPRESTTATFPAVLISPRASNILSLHLTSLSTLRNLLLSEEPLKAVQQSPSAAVIRRSLHPTYGVTRPMTRLPSAKAAMMYKLLTVGRRTPPNLPISKGTNSCLCVYTRPFNKAFSPCDCF